MQGALWESGVKGHGNGASTRHCGKVGCHWFRGGCKKRVPAGHCGKVEGGLKEQGFDHGCVFKVWPIGACSMSRGVGWFGGGAW